MSDERTYSDFGEPSSYTARWAGSPIYAVSYDARDGLGRITGKTETIGGTTTVYEYGYEASGRLDTVRQGGVLVSDYAYDANGNRTAAPNLTGTALYDDQDRLLAYGATTYAYTANGELASKTTSGGTTVYEYDALGSLRRVTPPAPAPEIEYLVHRRRDAIKHLAV